MNVFGNIKSILNIAGVVIDSVSHMLNSSARGYPVCEKAVAHMLLNFRSEIWVDDIVLGVIGIHVELEVLE